MCDKRSYRVLQPVHLPTKEVKCIFCGGKTSNVYPRVRAGGEKVKRYQCKECGRYFQETYINDYSFAGDKESEYTVVEV